MIYTSMFNKINSPIIISKKFGIAFSNTSDDEISFIEKQIQRELFQHSFNEEQEDSPIVTDYDICEIVRKPYFEGVFESDQKNANEIVLELAKKVICIHLYDSDYSYTYFKNEATDNPSWEKNHRRKVYKAYRSIR